MRIMNPEYKIQSACFIEKIDVLFLQTQVLIYCQISCSLIKGNSETTICCQI